MHRKEKQKKKLYNSKNKLCNISVTFNVYELCVEKILLWYTGCIY